MPALQGKLVSKVFKILLIFCVFFLLISLPGNFFPWSNQQKQLHTPANLPLQLTIEEQKFLEAHQPIRLAFDGYFPPYSFIKESGELAGISYDTIKLISKKLNIQITIDSRFLWKDIYQATLDTEIDAIATMVNRPERENQFSFTRPYVFKSLVIITHNSNQQIKDRSDLSGKTVVLMKNYRYSKRILKDFPDITPFYVENMREALTVIEDQQADAAIGFFAASYFLQNKYLLNTIKLAAFYDRNSSNESIAVRKDWPILAGIFQKALDAITEQEKQSIYRKWHPLTKLPINFEAIREIVTTFLLILLILLFWIAQIKRQNRRIKITQNKLQTVNSDLNHLKENLESQVLQRTKQFQNSERKYRSLVENLRDEYFFYQHDLNGVFTYLSPSVTNILGYSVEDLYKHYSTFLTDHPDNASIEDYTERYINGEKIPTHEIEVFDNKGHKHSLEVTVNTLYDDHGICIGLEGIAHDITLVKQTRDRLNWLSYYDDLTSLANRRLFKDRAEQIITLSHRQKQSMALLFLDLDRFKIVNDSLGHAVGDEVLKETASRIQAQLRDSDFAARMGGDEFTLILVDTNTDSAEIVAKKVLQSLLTPYLLNGQQFILGGSIGIAIYPKDGTDSETLLQQADNAMYFAKKEKIGYAFCSSGLHQISNRRLKLEQALRKALEQKCYDDTFELQIAYQSKHCVKSELIYGYEALVRWTHPDLGMISPVEFIPLAEETGLIAELSHWVLTRVCLQAVQWTKEQFNFGKIAINISAVELINSELANNIIEQIDTTSALHEWIEIEITESALMKSPNVAVNVMQQLVDAGILIAIDDFGTGYSSLSYLKNIPASYIKIDQSFIHNVLTSPEDQAVVRAVVAMSHALGKKVIAEGVETREQLEFVAQNGCDFAQGYLFSKPVVASKLITITKE
jgi:diguanylate cyclase (GGDEF)-like protein/PAS domain S-box-containing protein